MQQTQHTDPVPNGRASPPTRASRRRRGLTALAALGLGAALLLTPGLLPGGARGGVPGWAAADENDAVISIVDEVPIEEFLKAVGKKVGGKPIVWNPTDKQIKDKKIIGSINLKAPPDQLFDLVRALLTFYELAMVPVGPQGYEVYLVMDARAQGAIVKLKPKTIELHDGNLDKFENQDGLFVSATIRVENMNNLRDARNALTRIVTQQNIGNVTEVPASRSFVVTDFAPNVVAIYKLLRQLDVKPEGKVVTATYRQLVHASADEIEPILTDLFTGRERVSVNRVNQPPPQGGGASDVDEDPEPRIHSDVRTNLLIIYATQDDTKEIQAVIDHLDIPVVITNNRVNVIKLKNLQAEDTAQVLQSLIENTSIFGVASGSLGGSSTRPGGTARPQAARPAAGGDGSAPDQEERPAIVADVKSNSLIIAASKRQFEELERVIKLIDVRKAQVLIEAALVELTLDDSFRLAIELGLADDHGLTNPDKVSGFGFTSFGQTVFADKDGDTYLTDRIPPFVDSADAGAPTGLVGGIFALGQVPLIFNIVNSITRSRILQLPSLVTADNEEAVIEVKDQQPTTTSSTTSGGVTSGGFGNYEDAGTTLQISPHIADDKYLLLNIRMQVSAFDGESRVLANGTVIPPNRITRELKTVVTVPDRHTVVLGGLMGTNERSTVDKTPWVGDIPILGNLFKSTSTGNRQTSLFLFVTPTIMYGEGGVDILDRESVKRKQKADELIGYTDIWNSRFVGYEEQDGATGSFGGGAGGYAPSAAGAVRGSGSSTDGAAPGLLEATRFQGVSTDRLAAEAAHRRALLRRQAPAGR